MANPVPEGFHSVTAHMILSDARAAIDFYKKAFGAEELFAMPGPDGGVMHAEIKIGDSIIMIGSEHPGCPQKSPKSLNGTTVNIHLYVEDVDAAFKKAVDAGATPAMPPADMFWGDRYGAVADPFGHAWALATHVEDVPPAEMPKRAQEFFAQMGACQQ